MRDRPLGGAEVLTRDVRADAIHEHRPRQLEQAAVAGDHLVDGAGQPGLGGQGVAVPEVRMEVRQQFGGSECLLAGGTHDLVAAHMGKVFEHQYGPERSIDDAIAARSAQLVALDIVQQVAVRAGLAAVVAELIRDRTGAHVLGR
jgi:hypothetical protein